MFIRELIPEELIIKIPENYERIHVKGITRDSRKVKKDYMFFAIKGTQFDGHDFVGQVIPLGGIPVVERGEGVVVRDVRKAYALSLKRFYGEPDNKLKIIGITGTNGKSTVAYLLNWIFFPSGLVGTVQYFDGKEWQQAERTTPDSEELYPLFKKMLDRGLSYCFMEVSSHAITQRRIEGIEFAGGVFTNISRDHLDYHGTMEEYMKTKLSFFHNLPEESFIVYNKEDPLGREIGKLHRKKVSYGILQGMIRGEIVYSHYKGMRVKIFHNSIELPLHFPMVGEHNLKNLLAAYATSTIMGVDNKSFIERVEKFPGVRGRMELVSTEPYIYIDYAHTPDALFNILKSVRYFHKGRIITVFGAGGDRDKEKRPEMGRIVSSFSDISIVTSDNPRSEPPEKIIDDILRGIKGEYMVVVNRFDAIKKAISIAKKNDVIIIAGKGHETYQEIKGKKIHFDDREVVKEVLGVQDR